MPRDLESDFFEEYISSTMAAEEATKRNQEGASIGLLLLLSMPRMAIQMAWAAQWAAVGPYLGTMLPKYAVQLTEFVSPLTGLLVAPTIGVLSDRCTSRWGRRRPFFVAGGLLSCLCWILMGYTRQIAEFLGDYGSGKNGEETSRFYTGLLTIIFYTWMDITCNIAQTPVFLLVADFAGERQTTGCAMGEAWALVGTLLVSGYIYVFGAAHLTLRWFLAMLALVMFVTVTVAAVAAKEKPLQKQELDSESSWKRILIAFQSIYQGVVTLPYTLMVFAGMMVLVMYAWTSYASSKGQFFGIEVYGGDPMNADTCSPNCSEEQNLYNHGVRVAGGSTDTIFNVIGYAYLWVLPHFVSKLGAKRVLIFALIPQCLLVFMAFCRVVWIDVAIVISLCFTGTTMFALIVPVIVHIFGPRADIGMFVGAMNSANCMGQLINLIVGASIVETSMGYKLPILLGGIISILCVIVCIFFFRISLHSL